MITGGVGNNGVNAQTLASYYGGWTSRLKNNRQSTAFLNAADAGLEMDYAAQIFCSRFTWDGEAIKGFPVGYIERSLFFSGFCVGFISKEYGFLILPATATTFTILGEPARVLAQGYSQTFTLEPGEYAILKDTHTYSNPSQVIERKSSLVADCGRTIETYLQGMKKPIMLVTGDKDRITNQEIAKQIVNNTPYILASRNKKGGGMPDDEEPIFHNSPHNGGDLTALLQAKKALINEMLGKIGVDCNGAGKNQYQNEDEISKETFFTNLLNKQALDNRERFIADVKEMFDITLTLTNNVEEAQEEETSEEEESEDENNDERR